MGDMPNVDDCGCVFGLFRLLHLQMLLTGASFQRQEILALAWARCRGTAREHSLLVPLLISHPHLAGPS